MRRPTIWQPRNTPVRLTASTRCHWASGNSAAGLRWVMPALLTSTSMAPSSSSTRAAMRSTLGPSATSTPNRERAAAGLRDAVGDELGLASVGVRHRHRGAGLGQASGHGGAQPARPADDHRGLAVLPEQIEARHGREAGWIISSVMSSGSKKYTALPPALRPWVMSTGADLKRTPLALSSA